MRFIFGGVATVITGWIAHRFGPGVGGLFLAFPAIFPASVTLIERHERKRKESHGMAGKKRGRSVAAVVAAGAALGSLGLVAFAAATWLLAPRLAGWESLVIATLAWFAVSAVAWYMRHKL
ncbi:MAG TPA: DUF3147 family protein [Candidatus Binatia bacterium]